VEALMPITCIITGNGVKTPVQVKEEIGINFNPTVVSVSA
jgi:hypothetical protein